MNSKTMRRIALITALVTMAVLPLLWLDDLSSEQTPQNVPPDTRLAAKAGADLTDQTSDPATSDTRAEARPAGKASVAIVPVHAPHARVRLEVHAPSDVQTGDVFQARIDIQADIPVRDLAFSITYDKSRLSLIGRSEGEFVRRGGTASEFGVDEPSDGYIEVVFRAVDGSGATGSGNVVTLEFEATRPGSSRVELQNVTGISVSGVLIPDVSAAQHALWVR